MTTAVFEKVYLPGLQNCSQCCDGGVTYEGVRKDFDLHDIMDEETAYPLIDAPKPGLDEICDCDSEGLHPVLT